MGLDRGVVRRTRGVLPGRLGAPRSWERRPRGARARFAERPRETRGRGRQRYMATGPRARRRRTATAPSSPRRRRSEPEPAEGHGRDDLPGPKAPGEAPETEEEGR